MHNVLHCMKDVDCTSISKQIKPAVSKYTVAGYSGLCGNQFKRFMLLHISWVNWISDKSLVTS